MSHNNTLFSPDRDAFEDLQNARARALRERKNILIELGADWCLWSQRLEEFICAHPKLHLLRSHLYIHVRVHVGDDVTLSEICKILPPFDGIPHYFVFRPEGQLLHSQDTSPLEHGESYDYEKVWEFLSMWGSRSNKRLL